MITDERYKDVAVRFNHLPIGVRLKVVASACCSNPSPVLDEDIVTGKPVIRCANCGARC